MNIKRTFCLLLAFMMAFTIAFPTTIFADELDGELFDEGYYEYEEPYSEELVYGNGDTNTADDGNNGENIIVTDPGESNRDPAEENGQDGYETNGLEEEDNLLLGNAESVGQTVTADGNEQNESDAFAVLAIPVTITITKQPEDTIANAGEYAMVSVEAEGSDTLTYQWYYKAASDTTFKVSSVKTNEYKITMGAVWDGMQVYCKVSNGSSSVDSNTVTLSLPGIVSGDFVFAKIADTNNLALIEYKGTGVASIQVPNQVDGMTVTEIGKEITAEEMGVFEGKTELTAVALPNSITVIHDRAFKDCTNLSTMTTY